FQAEDGIRDFHVTGVQTCALPIFHASRGGATPGKMLIGIKVVRTDGSRISVLRGVGRYFGALLSGLVLCIGYLMAAFTGRKQALHDMLCDTLVVDKWAFTEHPEWQRRELGTATIVVLVRSEEHTSELQSR